MNQRSFSRVVILALVISLLFVQPAIANPDFEKVENNNTIQDAFEGVISVSGWQIEPDLQLTTGLNIVDPQYVFLPVVMYQRDYLYKDDFSNSASGWPIGSDAYSWAGYLDGEYKIKVLQPGWLIYATAGHEVTDFDMSIDIRQANSVPAEYGIVFGLNSIDDTYYIYLVDLEFQEWAVAYCDGTSFTPISYGSSAAIKQSTNTNRLQVIHKGITTNFLVNGSSVKTIDINLGTSPLMLGLAAAATDQVVVDVRFDNYLVKLP